MMRCLLLAYLVCACSGTKTAPPVPAGAPASLESTRAGDDDVIVARVNGRPVWGSCVTAQAARGGKTREAALRECVDFELLAQAADQRGFARDHDVVLATETALVSEVVAKVYEDGFTKPSDFGDLWKKAVEKFSYRYDHDEFRASTYVRVNVPEKGAPPGADEAAHAVAEKIAVAVANERGMMPAHFVEIAKGVAGAQKLAYQDVAPMLPLGLVKPYADALYAIPEVGRASGAVRTPWGWDVILWSDVVPAEHASHEEIEAKLLPNVKQQYFATWVAKLEHELGIHVERYKANIARLEDLP